MSKLAKVAFADLEPPKAFVNYRVATASRYTGLSVQMLYRDCSRGKIKHTRHGRAVTIPGSEILRLNGQSAA
jgi:hypothetical protein